MFIVKYYIILYYIIHRQCLALRPKPSVEAKKRLLACRSSSRLRWQHGVFRCPRPNMWARNTQIWLGNQSSHPGANIYLVRLLSAVSRRAGSWACQWAESCVCVIACMLHQNVCVVSSRRQPVNRESLWHDDVKWKCSMKSLSQSKYNSQMCLPPGYGCCKDVNNVKCKKCLQKNRETNNGDK